MKLRKFDYIIICGLGILITFTISFNIAMRFYGQNIQNNNTGSKKVDKLTSAAVPEKILPADTNIVLKLKKDGKEINVKNVSLKEAKNSIEGECTLTKLKKYYAAKGFAFLAEDSSGIIFEKDSRLIPQKYYLGLTDNGFAAVFKCDNEGNAFIEDKYNDIFERDAESLPEKERQNLENFQYEFDTKEEAQDELMALCS